MSDAETRERTSAWYLRFAVHEADVSSPTYARLARAVAEDDRLLALLTELPRSRRQPNLLFAAMRHTGIDVGSIDALDVTVEKWGAVAEVMATHRTQTNECARSSAILLAATQLGGEPTHLIELGASAGLCLLPDRYRHEYTGAIDATVYDGTPTVTTAVSGEAPTPVPLEIASRRGYDVNPLSAGNPEHRRWLASCVWPEHHERRRLLDSALTTAAEDPPEVVAADLLADIDEILAAAPDDGQTVVLTSAVLPYLDEGARGQVVTALTEWTSTHRHWLSFEAPGLAPGTDGDLGPARFAVGLDGHLLASMHHHGGQVHWA